MENEIINRVAGSKLVTIDLEDWYPVGVRSVFDIKDWLYEGLILREKEFRAHVKAFDWSQYQDHFVALTCSTDAIIPGWAYMLLTTAVSPYTQKVIIGDLEQLETQLYNTIIEKLDTVSYLDKPVIIKGCSRKPVPPNAYITLVQKLQPLVKSILYGEACSSVPLYKKSSK